MTNTSTNAFRFNLNDPKMLGCKLDGQETFAPNNFDELAKTGQFLAQKFYGKKARQVVLYTPGQVQDNASLFETNNIGLKTNKIRNETKLEDFLGSKEDIDRTFEQPRPYAPNKKDWSNACAVTSAIGLFVMSVVSALLIAGFFTTVMGG